MFRNATLSLVACAVLAACATGLAPRLETQLLSLGLEPRNAACLADELYDRLDRRDTRSLVEFLEGLNRAGTPGDAIDAILRIDNPAIAGVMAGAVVTCAFG